MEKTLGKIMKGPQPGGLPVHIGDPSAAIHLKAAACTGITVEPTVLAHVKRVIR